MMSSDKKEAKKEELLEKQEARELSSEELGQVVGGTDYAPRQWKETILYILRNGRKNQQ